jgi:hypothetical protein
VLPDLAAVVPMEAKLRQNRGDFAGLLSLKLNPNPFANDFGEISKIRGFLPNQVQQGFHRQCPVLISASEINLRQLFPNALCGPVLEL